LKEYDQEWFLATKLHFVQDHFLFLFLSELARNLSNEIRTSPNNESMLQHFHLLLQEWKGILVFSNYMIFQVWQSDNLVLMVAYFIYFIKAFCINSGLIRVCKYFIRDAGKKNPKKIVWNIESILIQIPFHLMFLCHWSLLITIQHFQLT